MKSERDDRSSMGLSYVKVFAAVLLVGLVLLSLVPVGVRAYTQLLTTGVDSGNGSLNPDCSAGCPETVGSLVNVTATPDSGWRFAGWSTMSGVSVSCPNVVCSFVMPNNTVTLKASFIQIVAMSALSSILLNAAAGTVYFIFPDSNTAHAKPATVGYAQVTDWTALGYVYGALNNMQQITALDTNTTYVDPATGAPKIRNSVIVLFASRLVNSLVYYYEVNGIAPLYWGFSGSWSGTEYYYNRSGQIVASISIPLVGGGSQDMPLIEVFKDQFGNTVVVYSGFGWKATFASGLYFKTALVNSLAGLTDSWYFWSWQDTNGNSFPDWYEVNPTPISHGN